MNKLKKIMLIFAIIIFVTIVILIYMLITSKKEDDIENKIIIDDDTSLNGGNQDTLSEKMEKVTNIADYFAVKDIVNRYFNYTSYLNCKIEDLQIVITSDINQNEVLEEYKKDAIKVLKNMLDKDYIEEFNINDDKIYNNFKIYTKDTPYIKEMYTFKKYSNVKVFLIEGILKNSKKDYKLLVKMDTENITFSIFPEEYIEKYNYNKDNADFLMNSDSIADNDDNIARYTNVNDAELATYYMNDYKEKILLNEKYAYDILDETYKEKRFQTFENFKKYVSDNKSKIEDIKIEKYKVNNYDDYIEYVCIDNYGNYYIFKETAIMDYTLILDTYTIDIPEVTEKYKKSSAKEKVAMNINKIFSAINQKDYTYVYGKLDETFKQNNYKTEQELENYLKSNLYDQNKISFEAYEQRDDIHIFVVKVSNYDNESETKNIKIIMQLQEGTDYVMSFSME